MAHKGHLKAFQMAFGFMQVVGSHAYDYAAKSAACVPTTTEKMADTKRRSQPLKPASVGTISFAKAKRNRTHGIQRPSESLSDGIY